MCLTCHCLCQKGLTCSRRTYQKGTFGKLGSNSSILARIVKKIHNLLQRLLRFILTCHIFKSDSCLLLDVGLRTAFAHSHHAAAFVHPAHKQHQKPEQQQGRKKYT